MQCLQDCLMARRSMKVREKEVRDCVTVLLLEIPLDNVGVCVCVHVDSTAADSS